jgi:acylphosphatase
MTIPPLSLGIIKGAEWLKALNAEMFLFGQSHGYMNKSAEHTSVHALAGRLQAGPSGNLELTVPSSLIKGVFDALDEPGAEFVVRNNRTECAIKVMTKEEISKLGGVSHISERGHSYHYTLGPIVELPATGDYDKLWAISIKSDDLEKIRKSYGLETSPQLGFYIPVGCKKKRVTEDNSVSKLAGVYTASGDKVQGVGLRKMYHSLLEEQGLPGLGVNNEDTGDVELFFDGDEAKRQEVFNQLGSRVQAKTGHPVTFAPVDIPQSSVPVKLTNKDTERLNAIHHLAYRMSNMYDPADPLLDSNDNFKQKLADRFRLQVNPRGLKGTVPSRAAEQLLGTRPMYEGMMPARRTRSEEEALSDMAEAQKRRLMKALSGGRGFLDPNKGGIINHA